MSMDIREATSREMEKNKKIVGYATGGVMFGEGMEKTNWKLVRYMCNVSYSFMPREKDVKVKADVTNPEIDVKHYTRFEKFPPTYLTCDFNETLRADAEHMYKLL